MKFLQKNRPFEKIILVISDLHLGAGTYINGRRNALEDFHKDHELIEFMDYYSSGEYAEKEVELVVNGDFLDLLAVPYVNFFDDEFWSEVACLEKLKMVVEAHSQVFESMKDFCQRPNKSIRYIIGNHDAEMILEGLQQYLYRYFGEECQAYFKIDAGVEFYNPMPGVYIQHGQQYERPHIFDQHKNVILSTKGERYFMPPWGSYYVTQVVNKFKSERPYINEVKPVKTFLIHALIYDTFFILRFMLANIFYFVMVRFWQYFMQKKSLREIIEAVLSEIEVFRDYESLTRQFFDRYKDALVLIVGHTHQAVLRNYSDGTTFINTGTWTKIVNLDLSRLRQGHFLTFAKVCFEKKDYQLEDFSKNVQLELNQWKGLKDRPYDDFF